MLGRTSPSSARFSWIRRTRVGRCIQVALQPRGRAILDRTVLARIRGEGPYLGKERRGVKPPPTKEAWLQALFDALAWKKKACRPENPEVGPYEYVVRGKTITEGDWLVVIDAIKRHGVRERYVPLAYWPSDELGANPDAEIVNAIRPGMATIPGSLLLGISSPYARRGVLWDAYRKHHGKDGDPVLVWQGHSRSMNPSLSEETVAAGYARDEVIASAEWGAEFRRDIDSYISREVVEAAVVEGRFERPPLSDTRYLAFVDPSGGSSDSMTLAIGHYEAKTKDDPGVIVLDAIHERRPPFSPWDVVRDFVDILKMYRVKAIVGDRYGGEFCRGPFRKLGIEYGVSEKAKSDLYRDLLPLLNSRRVELRDHARLVAQLTQLERRTARGGRDSIDHGPNSHDDVVNAVAGVADLTRTSGAVTRPRRWSPRSPWWPRESSTLINRGSGPPSMLPQRIPTFPEVGSDDATQN